MSDQYLGEIRLFSFNFAPKGWAFCNGQILSLQQNTALFSLLGTTYGGNGETTFALPNLQAAAPMHVGTGFTLGQTAGEHAHTLIQAEMPAHTHVASARAAGSASSPAAAVWAISTKVAFGPATSPVVMASGALGTAGGSQPHDNMPPYLAMNYCIALVGIFPSRS